MTVVRCNACGERSEIAIVREERPVIAHGAPAGYLRRDGQPQHP
jgi:hypothetical protein